MSSILTTIPNLPRTFISIDVETTGLNSTNDRIIELSAIKYTHGETDHPVNTSLIRIDFALPANIKKLTGISDEMLRSEGISISAAMRRLEIFVEDLPLVAFNAEFDKSFLDQESRRLGMPPITNEFICALKMARRAWPNMPRHRLSDLAELFGNKVQAHRAEADAALAVHVYAKAVYILGTRN